MAHPASSEDAASITQHQPAPRGKGEPVMPWNDSDELVVAGTGQIYVADVGTALPTSPTASLNAGFVGLGYTTEDGVTLTVSPDIAEFNAWQKRQPVRRELVSLNMQVAFSLQQWNEETVPFAFGGGEVVSTTGGYRYNFPADTDALDERALIVELVDGGRQMRIVLPRGNVTDDVEANFNRSDPAVLPVTWQALADDTSAPYLLTSDSAAFAAGS